jgi:hypothetical protein
MLGTRSITQRLAHLLLHLSELYGVEDPDGKLIAAAFTHADLAHMVGATRQWVTISLKRMQDKNIVVNKRSQIVVCRQDILEDARPSVRLTKSPIGSMHMLLALNSKTAQRLSNRLGNQLTVTRASALSEPLPDQSCRKPI